MADPVSSADWVQLASILGLVALYAVVVLTYH